MDSPNLVCALKLWRLNWDCQWVNLVKFFLELSAHHMSIFLFTVNPLSKYQWIVTKLDISIYRDLVGDS